MIRGDDHQGVVEHPAPRQLVEEDPQPPIEISECNRHKHRWPSAHVVRESCRLVERVPAPEGQAVLAGGGPEPEARGRSVRNLVGRVGVVVVQEGEERAAPRPAARRASPGTPGRPPRHPSRAPSSGGSASIRVAPVLLQQPIDHRARREQVEPAAEADVAGEDLPDARSGNPRSARSPGPGRSRGRNSRGWRRTRRCHSRGRPRYSASVGYVVVERRPPVGRQLMGPPPGEQAAVRRQGPGGGRERLVEPHPPAGQPLEVGRRRAAVAVEAQVPGPDRIPDDQQHVPGAGGRRRQGGRPPGAPTRRGARSSAA